MINPETFHLEGRGDLTVEHRVTNGILQVGFRGGYMGRYDERFEGYVAHLDALSELAKDPNVQEVECHLDEFGEALSRTQHAVYRWLYAVRSNVSKITVFATDRKPEQSEHLRMAQLFVDGLAGRGGAELELVKV